MFYRFTGSSFSESLVMSERGIEFTRGLIRVSIKIGLCNQGIKKWVPSLIGYLIVRIDKISGKIREVRDVAIVSARGNSRLR
jgi:hypothetical protein